MKHVEVNAEAGVQGAFLERAVRKQKKAERVAKTLPPLAKETCAKPTQDSTMRRVRRSARYLLGIGRASER